MMAACWFAVMKAGGIAVATMPLLRAKELTDVITKAQVTHALCDARLAAELDAARAACPTLTTVVHFETTAPDGIEARAGPKSAHFANVMTAAEDTALIAFTSERPVLKGTMHFYRDVLASCDCWPRAARDCRRCLPEVCRYFRIWVGGPLLFPCAWAPHTAGKGDTDALLQAIAENRATVSSRRRLDHATRVTPHRPTAAGALVSQVRIAM
jgi:2-aminobenzoate-CoA ligase